MFGFVRPTACRSSAPRSVTDGCPYPPLPCRAKNRNKIQLFSHRKQEINGNGGNAFHRLRTPSTAADSFHRCGGPPPSKREVWGLRAPSRRFLYNSGCRVETLLISMGVMGFLGERVHSFHRCGGPPPSMREACGFAGQGLRPCRRLHIGALRSPLSPFARPLEDSIQPRVQGRNPARFKGGYGVPRGFKGEKSKSPPNPLGLAERLLAAHFTYFIFNSARSVNVPAFFGREHPPRTQEI